MKYCFIQGIQWDGKSLTLELPNMDNKQCKLNLINNKVKFDNLGYHDLKNNTIRLEFAEIKFPKLSLGELKIYLTIEGKNYPLTYDPLSSNMKGFRLSNIYDYGDHFSAIPYFNEKGFLRIQYGNTLNVLMKTRHPKFTTLICSDPKIKEARFSLDIKNENEVPMSQHDLETHYERFFVCVQDRFSNEYLILEHSWDENDNLQIHLPQEPLGNKRSKLNIFLVGQVGKLLKVYFFKSDKALYFNKKWSLVDKNHEFLNVRFEAVMANSNRKNNLKGFTNFRDYAFYYYKYNRETEKKLLVNSMEFKDKKLTLNLSEPILFNFETAKLRLVFKQEEFIYHLTPKDFLEEKSFTIDLQEFYSTLHDKTEPSKWDLYLSFPDIDLSYRLGCYLKKTKLKKERYLTPIEVNADLLSMPYLTGKSNISIGIMEKSRYQSELSRIHTTKMYMWRGVFHVEFTVKEVVCTPKHVLLKYRNEYDPRYHVLPISVKKLAEDNFIIKFKVNLKNYKFEQFYWDFFMVAEINGVDHELRVKNPILWVRRNIHFNRIGNTFKMKDNFIIYPCITRGNGLSLSYRMKGKYDKSWYMIKELIVYFYHLIFKRIYDKRNIILVYEKFCEAAQDNGFYFFKHCYKAHPEENLYFIIDKKSKDYANVKPYHEKVVQFMSFKHLLYLYAAKLLISSESKSHSYVWRVPNGKVRNALGRKKQVFLQHGVTALKRVDYVFRKKASNSVDLFVVCSDYEKEIIKNNFFYDDDEIIVTGFSRWDVLEDKSQGTREIFLMPTWRIWMDDVSLETFIESDYYANYIGLLNSPKLAQLLEEYNCTLSFYVHPKFQMFVDRFMTKNPRIKTIRFGQERINTLLMRSSLLITDYSSVAWDFYYLKKPVVFYQFDVDKYNEHQGSYLDMETELFGDRVFNVEEMIGILKEYINNDFKEKDCYAQMRTKYYKYIDKNNSERIYQEIKKRPWLFNEK